MLPINKELCSGFKESLSKPWRGLTSLRAPRIGRLRLASLGLAGLVLVGCRTPAAPTVLNPEGVVIKTACQPDGSVDLQLTVDEEKLHSSTGPWKNGGDSWTMIAEEGSNKKALVAAHKGRIMGSWTANFPGRVGSIRPGNGFSDRGFRLVPGIRYIISFYDSPYTNEHPELNNKVAQTSIFLNCN